MGIRQKSAPKIVFLIGPTAIGKTRLAVGLSKKIKGEIVSCDSMQVYRNMRILSRAPSQEGRGGTEHHLLEFVSPEREFSVSEFRKSATEKIERIIERGKIPIVVGGSGLYAKALVDGLFPSPDADANFRKRMQGYIATYGYAALYRKLVDIDPASAARIHPHDSRRVIRALEIYHSTKKTMTELKAETVGLKDKFDIRIFGLRGPRARLYEDINERVEEMFGEGAVEEVERLMKRRLSKTAAAVLGFKEIAAYLKGECSMEEAKSLLMRNTRRFAKRQLAWFRPDKRISWFDVSRMSEKRIIEAIRKELCQRKAKNVLRLG